MRRQLFVLLVLGCGRPSAWSGGGLPDASAEACVRWLAPRQTGTLKAGQLSEVSGMAASHKLTGVLWVHNDSGHKPLLWAVDRGGTVLASFRLKHQPHRDWEDLAIGPCAGRGLPERRSCLYVADTGDNTRSRTTATILRWPEPDALPATTEGPSPASRARTRVADEEVEVFALRYPAGAEDVEALAVLPDTRVILVAKQTDGRPSVYRVTLHAGAPLMAEWLGRLDVRQPDAHSGHAVEVTAADLTSDGRWLLVRTYGHTLVFDLHGGLAASVKQAEAALANARCIVVPSVSEGATEAVAWDPEGGFWQVAEGVGAGLWRVGCAR